MGGDTATGFFESSFHDVATKIKFSKETVQKIWRTLKPDDLEFIKFLKTDKESMTSGELLKEVTDHCSYKEESARRL